MFLEANYGNSLVRLTRDFEIKSVYLGIWVDLKLFWFLLFQSLPN